MAKNSIREASLIFGDSSLLSMRRRREGRHLETFSERVTPVQCPVLSLRSPICLCICALPVGSIWETLEGRGIETWAGIRIQYNLTLSSCTAQSPCLFKHNVKKYQVGFFFFIRNTHTHTILYPQQFLKWNLMSWGCMRKAMRDSFSLPSLKGSGGHLKVKAFSKTQMQANCKITVCAGLDSGWPRFGDEFFKHLGKGEWSLPASRPALNCIQGSLLHLFPCYALI